MPLLSIFCLFLDLEEPERRISYLRSISFHFSVVTTLPLTKAEIKTEKSLTPPSYSCSEKKKNFASKCQLFVTGVMVS